MIEWPSATQKEIRIPKEVLYRQLNPAASLKNKFVTDVDYILIKNSLTTESLLLTKDSEIEEILLLAVVLKKKESDRKIIEAIARQNPHKLIFQLIYGNYEQLALYEGKLYRAEWKEAGQSELPLQGNTIAEIWENLARQIVLLPQIRQKANLSLRQQLDLQNKIDSLKMNITKLEKAAWKEEQPKKRFDLYTKLQERKQQLEELLHG